MQNESFFNISLNCENDPLEKNGDQEAKMKTIANTKKMAFYDNLFVEKTSMTTGHLKRKLRLNRNLHNRSTSNGTSYGRSSYERSNERSSYERSSYYPQNSSFSKVNDSSFIKNDESWKPYRKKMFPQYKLVKEHQMNEQSKKDHSFSKQNESQNIKEQSSFNLNNSRRMAKTEVSDDESVADDKFEKSMVESVDIEYEDQKPKKTIGDEAILDYYMHYKKLHKIYDKNQFSRVKESFFTNFLQGTEREDMLPQKLAIVKREGNNSDLNLKNFYIGNRYAKLISDGMSNFNYDSVKLNNNRLTEDGAKSILQNINRTMKVCNLSKNKIGKTGVDLLVTIIKSGDNNLQELYQESNKLGKSAIKPMLQVLTIKNYIRILDISDNMLTDYSAMHIAHFLESSSSMIELYLYWNLITSRGGSHIFESLKKNESLKVLDISDNYLCKNMKERELERMLAFFSHNTTMIHQDMSNNKLVSAKQAPKIIPRSKAAQLNDKKNVEEIYNPKEDRSDVKTGHNLYMKFVKALKLNQTLYGFHFSGNYIKSKANFSGFLVEEEVPYEISGLRGPHIKKRIKGIKCNFSQTEFEAPESRQECCWICEGWTEYVYSYPIETKHEVFIHFSFNKYQPIKMIKTYDDKAFTKIMNPPTNVYYFFSTRGTVQINTEDLVCPCNISVEKLNIQGYELNQVYITQLNFLSFRPNQLVIQPDYIPYVSVIPRSNYSEPLQARFMKDESYNPKEHPVMKILYSERDDFLTEYMESDWKLMEIQKDEKSESELNILYEIYQHNYKYLYNTFIHFASMREILNQANWTVSVTMFKEFLKTINAYSDISQLEVVTVDKLFERYYKKKPSDKDIGILRHEFIDQLFFIGYEKYGKSKLAMNLSSALRSWMSEDGLEKSIQSFKTPSTWRNDHLYSQEIAYLQKKYENALRLIFLGYKNNKGEDTSTAGKIHMAQNEFTNIFQMCDIMNENFCIKDLYTCYCYSIRPKSRLTGLGDGPKMNYYEFQEAIVRVSEVIKPEKMRGSLITAKQSKRINRMPLHIILESMLNSFVEILIKTNNIPGVTVIERSSFDM